MRLCGRKSTRLTRTGCCTPSNTRTWAWRSSRFLPRYFSPRLLEPTRILARSADPARQAGAISGLISQLDTAPETRAFVRGLLGSSHPAVRGRAAEYLCWLGGPEDYPYLTKSSNAEADVHARAAMVEAAAAIKHRAAIFGAGTAAVLPPAASPAATYQQMAGVLAEHATAATRVAVIERLAQHRGGRAVVFPCQWRLSRAPPLWHPPGGVSPAGPGR